MLAIGFGLTASLVWAVHDLLARKLSQGTALLPILIVVLGSGCVVLLPVVALNGDWSALTGQALVYALLSGLGFTVALGSLYRAFSLAPVRLVSPVIGSYPMLSLAIAAWQGHQVTPGDWLAVAAIVLGIAIVALAARDDGPQGYAASPAVALGWAALSALGFAATFGLAQQAARLGGEVPAMLIGRVVALLVILALAIAHRSLRPPPRGQLWVLALMGALDAFALGLVTAAGSLPRAEYASVTSSLFGVLTILLAAWFLRERVRPVQWLGIGAVFAGIAGLGLQG